MPVKPKRRRRRRERQVVVRVALDRWTHHHAENTARRDGAELAEALQWWAHLMASAYRWPNGKNAALARGWLVEVYPERKAQLCR
jgi:hypothetical protein